MDLTFASLYRLRDEMADVTKRIADLVPARDRLTTQAAHTDEIVAYFRRGLEAAAQDYEARLAVFFGNPRQGDVSQLLRDGAAMYYMRDLVASKVPALIKRLSPSSENAMPLAEQQQTLRTANAELSRLIDRHAELVQAFGRERLALREMRQPGNLSRGDAGRNERASIESQELTLNGEMDVMRADQARFASLRGGPVNG